MGQLTKFQTRKVGAGRIVASQHDIDACNQIAKERARTICVVVMDGHDGREIRCVSDDYTFGDEFEAFDGRVLYVSGE